MKQNVSVEFSEYSLDFSPNSGGFPKQIMQNLRRGKVEQVVVSEKTWMRLQLADGSVCYPFLPEDMEPSRRQDPDGTTYLLFSGIPWRTDATILKDWTLDIEYELHSDGVGFITATVINDGEAKPDVQDFWMQIPMNFGEDQNVLYHYWLRPQDTDSGAIQAYSQSIYNELSQKESMTVPDMLLPVMGFELGKAHRLYRRIEWFIEEQVSLQEMDPTNTKTRLDWTEKGPVLTYSFAAKGMKCTNNPYVWTNRFGFTLTQTPKVRKKAPVRLYHQMDAYTRYPSDAQIAKMAAEGADMLILHEAWRKNMRNGGAPWNEKEFRRVIDTCHRYDIRVAPYIRGNEDSAQENQCGWFDLYFKKNYDGLYVDYGGPQCYVEKNGLYPGGRVGFHKLYKVIQSLRQQVGEDGTIILHIGPFFGGTVLPSLVDAFCSGECEKGKMIETRDAHAHYSKSTMAPTSLWTAAFPSYRTSKICPHAVVTGQFPHVSLGVQNPSSSLANPVETGNATYMRTIWRYFGLMKGESDISFANDVCDDSFRCDCDLTGVGEYTMTDGSRLLLVGNFADHQRLCTISGFTMPSEKQKCQCLFANEDTCRVEPCDAAQQYEFTLPAYGTVGVLFFEENEKWQARLAEFEKPYPEKDEADIAFDSEVQRMGQLRSEPMGGKKLYMQMYIPFSNPTWEKPLWDDLYETTLYRLFATDSEGNRMDLGYVSKAGLTEDIPALEDRPWQTESSPWISLHDRLPAGCWNMELHAYRVDEDYYSLAEVHLKTAMNDNPVVLTYMGELDEDRSRLTFKISIYD